MADGSQCRVVTSGGTEMTALGRALSQVCSNGDFHPQACTHHSNAPQECRRRRLSSSGSLVSLERCPDAEVRVMVVNTGGTIGMTYQNNVLSPEPNALVKALRRFHILHDEQYALQTCLYDCYGPPDKTLVLPLSKKDKRVVYTVLEYSPLLDSCNMTMDDWARIGKDIENQYEKYDGFVVLHGTDTMAYTASALSFMFEHLGKPVILTGSQVPIYEMRSDGRDNLLGALLIAGQFVIPEVCLYFHHKLYRGNRVTKVDSGSFNAFSSPNLPPLANAEVDVKINWDMVWWANTTSKFQVQTVMNRNVGLLRLFPGITTQTVRAFLQPPMEGIVLETFGSGNAPSNLADLLEEFSKATERGVIMVNCTQCLRGSVITRYATGKALSDAGLVPGCDMTPEAALSKLSYVLAKEELSTQEKRKMLSENLRGEITHLDETRYCLRNNQFLRIISECLNISCKEELEAIRDALNPTLACAAAKTGDIEALLAIRKMGSTLSMEDYDGRTPLHIAACEGHYNVVEYLLNHGATVYAKDRYGHTPLHNAVQFRRGDVVKLLRKTGAHFSRDELEKAGSELCRLAACSDLDGLAMWHLAGADISMPRYDGETAMEVALKTDNLEVAEFLKQCTAMDGDFNGFPQRPREA
ncbi:60 kDa lysophospholipase [Brienomyrus brachyistius]|uniref:60 kDa lysophospholipase n=1 Tax=Brienomyrus brachyistius TaxID=42636 RepID=UPI0020B1D83D|nr:60 kDa lysophospholipase [Brienomyrus brachyistius]